jgi:hypothetical protein
LNTLNERIPLMDIALLADALTEMLAPALPHLVRGGRELVAQAGEEVATGAWERLKGLWERLRPKVEAKPAAAEAAEDVARAPEDGDAKASLRNQLKKLLAEDEAFAAEIAGLLEGLKGDSYKASVQGSGAVAQGPGAVAAGAGGVAVGRDVQGDVVLGRDPRRTDRE